VDIIPGLFGSFGNWFDIICHAWQAHPAMWRGGNELWQGSIAPLVASRNRLYPVPHHVRTLGSQMRGGSRLRASWQKHGSQASGNPAVAYRTDTQRGAPGKFSPLDGT